MRRRRADESAAVIQALALLLRRATPRQVLTGAGALLLALALYGLYNWSRGPSVPITFPGGGSETSEPVDGDWYQLHFTAPTGRRAKTAGEGGIDEHLVALMGRAQKTLDVAAYDFDLMSVAAAMAAAKDRGVRVRMVIDSDTVEKAKEAPDTKAALDRVRDAGIPVVEDGRTAIMHDKFAVVDGEWVQTGSWNYSRSDTFQNNNNMVIIRGRALAENYTAEFEKMFGGRFGAKKARGVPHPVLEVGGSVVRNSFAPKDRVAEKVIEEIGSAKTSLYFLAFQFTHDGIGHAVRERAKAGVAVGGVFETRGSDTAYSEFGKMKAAGLDVYADGNPFVMHHKVMILDEKVVLFGSYNFTDSADKENDENLLIVEDAGLARRFKGEYDRVREKAKNR